MARSYILGAGGFLGQQLAKSLVRKGERVVLVGLRAPLLLDVDPDQVITGHLSSFESLDSYTETGDIFYYLIGSMTPANSTKRPSEFIATNLELFVRFLEWAEGNSSAQIVYASSGGTVYGDAVQIPTPETAPLMPISFYGLLKVAAEQYLRLFVSQGRLNGTVLRIANPYGPGQMLSKGQGLIPALIQKIKAGETVEIVDGGRAVRDYVYVDDVVEAMILAGSHSALRNETINVGTGVGTSVSEVVSLVETVMQVKARKVVRDARPGDVSSSVLDPSKLTFLTGWAPKYSLEAGLRAHVSALENSE